MHDLLFLVHRLPYPPNKGDKIRSFNMLTHLTRKYHVLLGTFVDDPDDWRYAPVVRELCGETCIVTLDPTNAKWRSLRGFITGEALTLPYYRDAKLQSWVDSILGRGNVKHVVVYCCPMAQYVTHHLRGGIRSIMDFVDVDSDKWRTKNKRSRGTELTAFQL